MTQLFLRLLVLIPVPLKFDLSPKSRKVFILPSAERASPKHYMISTAGLDFKFSCITCKNYLTLCFVA